MAKDNVPSSLPEEHMRRWRRRANLPGRLTVVGTLARGLEEEPLLEKVLLWDGGVGEGV